MPPGKIGYAGSHNLLLKTVVQQPRPTVPVKGSRKRPKCGYLEYDSPDRRAEKSLNMLNSVTKNAAV